MVTLRFAVRGCLICRANLALYSPGFSISFVILSTACDMRVRAERGSLHRTRCCEQLPYRSVTIRKQGKTLKRFDSKLVPSGDEARTIDGNFLVIPGEVLLSHGSGTCLIGSKEQHMTLNKVLRCDGGSNKSIFSICWPLSKHIVFFSMLDQKNLVPHEVALSQLTGYRQQEGAEQNGKTGWITCQPTCRRAAENNVLTATSINYFTGQCPTKVMLRTVWMLYRAVCTVQHGTLKVTKADHLAGLISLPLSAISTCDKNIPNLAQAQRDTSHSNLPILGLALSKGN
ncbi:hypothetical protein RRG08_029318 [Elysia crispata]|uniref:Uncharacterized protein n=1 Tax=Elysia crispata TaxID=231223 RepID=A0AAE1ARL4_9GAST|nr:hypothetical protein RRG08_029318 [Elysia crispata]